MKGSWGSWQDGEKALVPQGLNFLMSQPGYTLEKKGLALPCTISTSILLGSLGLVWGLLNPYLGKPLERAGTLELIVQTVPSLVV